ncbi:lipase family protein [Nocardia tengchongensis]
MTAQSVTSTEPTTQDKITYQLCEYANLINAVQRNGGDRAAEQQRLEHKLLDLINPCLTQNQMQINGWKVVWGPGVALFDTDLYAVNAMYVAQSTDDSSKFVIAMAGSTDALVSDWIIEDTFMQQVPWLTHTDAKYTAGTAIGVDILRKMKPSDGIPGAGQTLLEFLGALQNKAVDLTVTGHSLGGALSITLALLLRDTQWLWDLSEKAKISVLSTAGPSFCNQQFVDYATGRLQRVQRYSSDLDVIPHVWNSSDIDYAKTLYSDYNRPAPDAVKTVFDLLKALASTSGQYVHFEPASGWFHGTFNQAIDGTPGLKPDQLYLQQVGYQHIGGYHQFFEIPGVTWPSGVMALPPAAADMGMSRILDSVGAPLGDGVGQALANRRPVTVPVDGQPEFLPIDHNSPEAEQLMGRITAQIAETIQSGR